VRLKRNPGFTLIEVVVAMAILGVALVVIIELFSGGLRAGRISEEYTQAVNYAHQKMEEMIFADTIEEGSKEGEFDKDFRWKIEVSKMDILVMEVNSSLKPPADMYQIKLDVLWKTGARERSTSLEFYKTTKTKALEES
jgi:general secretion pathway protein I